MYNATTTCSYATSFDSGSWNLQSSTCQTLYGESTSTDQTFVNGFSAGEVVISVELFLVLIVAMVILYHVMFRRFKIKNP